MKRNELRDLICGLFLLMIMFQIGIMVTTAISAVWSNETRLTTAHTQNMLSNLSSVSSSSVVVSPVSPPVLAGSVSDCAGTTQRTYDGVCTTSAFSALVGSVYNATLEIVEPGPYVDYADAPNERVLSNMFFKGPEGIRNSHSLNLWFALFAEVQDIYMHDAIDTTLSGLTPAQLLSSTSSPSSAILDFACTRLIATTPGAFVDPTDPFSPISNPSIRMPYLGVCDAKHLTGNACSPSNPQAYCTKSSRTPWIDLDNSVYPNDPSEVGASRTFVDGKLKTTQLSSGEEIPPTYDQTGRQPPFNGRAPTMPSPNTTTTSDTAGGWLGGTSLNTLVTISLFYREHNRIAAQLKSKNPDWTDEQLFQRARAINIAQVQAIYAYEWLRAGLGPLYDSLFGKEYPGYDRTIRPTISTSFDTALRSVHSAIYEKLDVTTQGPLTMLHLSASVATANPSGQIDLLNGPIFLGSTEFIVRSWLVEPCNEMDSYYTELVRNVLPPRSPAPALDLAASDIRRGRLDHTPNYQAVRAYWRSDNLYQYPGCVHNQTDDSDSLPCFLAITSDILIAGQLKAVYRRVDRIDLHVGAMVENRNDSVPLPLTYAHIIAKTLRSIRSSDAFWFENTAPQYRQFTDQEIEQLRSTRLIDIINRNTPLTCPSTANGFVAQPLYSC